VAAAPAVGARSRESTTEAYATALALFFQWCQAISRDWRVTASEIGRFVFWLRYYDPNATAGAPRQVVRGERRINAVTAAVREFFKHAAAVGLVEKAVLDALYDLVEDHDLPAEVRGERATTHLRSRPRHRLSEPETVVDAASRRRTAGGVHRDQPPLGAGRERQPARTEPAARAAHP
jgi:hypothetical protein